MEHRLPREFVESPTLHLQNSAGLFSGQPAVADFEQ